LFFALPVHSLQRVPLEVMTLHFAEPRLLLHTDMFYHLMYHFLIHGVGEKLMRFDVRIFSDPLCQ